MSARSSPKRCSGLIQVTYGKVRAVMSCQLLIMKSLWNVIVLVWYASNEDVPSK